MARFEPTRQAGLDRLAAFLPHAGRHYAAQRNHDRGPERRDNVSALSPYVRHRMVREEEVLAAVLSQHSPSAAEKFIQEVFWRTYFKGYLESRPLIWDSYRSRLAELIETRDEDYAHAAAGRTGIDCFDAWVTELLETGYLHNHARMWFASIWIFTLRLPWELGADLMYRHLLDGDPASNTLSWRWVGGLHTKGKTYLARADNIAAYTEGRFSPVGLAHDAPTLEESSATPSRKIPGAASALPSVRLGLLVTEEDLHPESLDRNGATIAAVAGATSVEERSLLPVSEHCTSFTNRAMSDCLNRAAAHFAVPATRLASLHAIEEWADARGIDTIATAYAPTGPVASQLSEIAPRLKSKGISLVQIRRDFDTSAWPHGTKGFFAMKEKIPMLLRTLSLHGHGHA
jgi:deoxyribodipyrimidine photo-lyase